MKDAEPTLLSNDSFPRFSQHSELDQAKAGSWKLLKTPTWLAGVQLLELSPAASQSVHWQEAGITSGSRIGTQAL